MILMNTMPVNNIESNQNIEILYKAKLHWISFFLPILYMVIGAIGPILLFIGGSWFSFFPLTLTILFIKGLYDYIQNKNVQIYLTQSHLTLKTGILSKKLKDISLTKFEGMALYQGLFGRLLGYGIISISTGGVVVSYKIKNPVGLRNIILKQIK